MKSIKNLRPCCRFFYVRRRFVWDVLLNKSLFLKGYSAQRLGKNIIEREKIVEVIEEIKARAKVY